MDLLRAAQAVIRATDPLERTISDWQVLLDWNLQRQRNMVVIDPNDPEGLMYLTDPEYRELQKVCLSMGTPLTVVARRGSIPPALVTSAFASFKKIPPVFMTVTSENHKQVPRPTMFRNGLWSVFIKARSWIPANIKVDANTGAIGLPIVSGTQTVWKTTMMWGRQAFHYSGLTRQSLCFSSLEHLGRHLVTILEHQGPNRLIQRLKIYLFVMNNYIGGERMKTTEPLGIRVRLKNGLPACFPQRVRDAIKSGSLPVIRWWASLLNMYKALGAKYGEIDLSGIQAPPYTGDLGHWAEAVLTIWETLWETYGPLPRYSPRVDMGRFTQKAGPYGPNVLTAPIDAWRWFCEKRNWILEYLEANGDMGSIMKMVELAQVADMEIRTGKASSKNGWTPKGSDPAHPLGKLAFKLEAAGKIRVFALVDWWTQTVLEPLHSYIFKILELLPSDATFDQTGRLEKFVRECHEKGIRSFFCYDLKSATDIIPLPLYVELLIPLIGRRRAELWAKILVDRGFTVPKPPKGGGSLPEGVVANSVIRYTRGQPMGALSSWAGLAIVHHFLVQFAHMRVGGQGWFLLYLVLGDDIVIADATVAAEYLKICEEFGIKVGLAKSLISQIGLINFANQTFIGLDNISPISLKEELKARSWSARLALAKRVLARWFPEDKSVISLIKRTLTVPQWNHYQGLTLRGKDYLGLGVVMTLIAQNPFIGASADKPVGAEELFDWVKNFLNPITSSDVKRTSFIEDLTVVFYRELLISIEKKLPLLQEFILAMREASISAKRLLANDKYPLPSFPIIGWSFIAEELIQPRVERIIEELQEILGSAQSALGYHQQLYSGSTRVLKDQTHGPNAIFTTEGVLRDITINHEKADEIFKEICSLWLKTQGLTCFGVGAGLNSLATIKKYARKGAFGSLLFSLLPEEYNRKQENLKRFGQVTDPNLVKLPIDSIQNTILSHFGKYGPLPAVSPEMNSPMTVLPSEEQKAIEDKHPTLALPAIESRIEAESTFLAAQPAESTSSAEVKATYSELGSLLSVESSSKAKRMKTMLNHSREMRGLPLIRGELVIVEVQLGKPGFGDSYTDIRYTDPNDDIGVD